MSFRDYSATPAGNVTLGDGTYIGPNMLRNKVRPALQQLAADGRELADDLDAAVNAVNTTANLTLTSAMALSRLYESTAVGLAATAEGGYFAVVGDDADTFAILYREVSGAAVEVTRFPSLSATIDISIKNAGIVMDAAIVEVGGVEHATGTDVTAAIQALLDMPRPGSSTIRLVIDGPALVTGLVVDSDTIIDIMPGGALILADDANAPIIRNRNQVRGVDGETSDQMFARVLDRNIHIRCAGIIHGNQANQEHHNADNTWVVPISMFGVDGLTIDVPGAVLNPRTFGVHMALCENVYIPRYHMECPNDGGLATTPEQYNQDGLHFNGPCRHIYMGHLTGRSGDDFVALNADDGPDNLFTSNFFGPKVGQGDITDVYVENMDLTDALYFFRILSKLSRVDRVYVNVMRGTTYGRYVTIDGYQEVDLAAHPGNVGVVTFNDVDVQILDFVGDNILTVGKHIHIDVACDSIRFNNLKRNPPLVPAGDLRAKSLMTLGTFTDANSVHIGWLEIRDDPTHDTQGAIQILAQGRCKHFSIGGGNWIKGDTALQQGGLLIVGTTLSPSDYELIEISNFSANRTGTLVRHQQHRVGRVVFSNITMTDSLAGAGMFTIDVNADPTFVPAVRWSNVSVPQKLIGGERLAAVVESADRERVTFTASGGTLTVFRKSAGIASVTRLSIGLFKVTFTTDIAHYVGQFMPILDGDTWRVATATDVNNSYVTFSVRNQADALVDPTFVSVEIQQ